MATLAQDHAPQIRARQARGVLRRTLHIIRKKPLGAAAFGMVLLLVFTAIFADVVATHDPLTQNTGSILQGPSAEHWMGADHTGRDTFSRIVHGARISLMVGIFATVMGAVGGTVIG